MGLYYQTKLSSMQQTLTPDCLVRYIYRETSLSETLMIQSAMSLDAEMAEDYRMLFQAYRHLPKATFSPSPKTLQSILAYSERTAVQEKA